MGRKGILLYPHSSYCLTTAPHTISPVVIHEQGSSVLEGLHSGGTLFIHMVLVSSNIYPRSCVLVCCPPPEPSSGQSDCAMNSTQLLFLSKYKNVCFQSGASREMEIIGLESVLG